MNSTIPKVDGVSNPSGMAVTSSRPVRFAKRRAMKKKAKSPTITPNAVPGTIAETAKSVGNPNPLNRPTISNKPATLSSISPKKALMSPTRAQRYASPSAGSRLLANVDLGGSGFGSSKCFGPS